MVQDSTLVGCSSPDTIEWNVFVIERQVKSCCAGRLVGVFRVGEFYRSFRAVMCLSEEHKAKALRDCQGLRTWAATCTAQHHEYRDRGKQQKAAQPHHDVVCPGLSLVLCRLQFRASVVAPFSTARLLRSEVAAVSFSQQGSLRNIPRASWYGARLFKGLAPCLHRLARSFVGGWLCGKFCLN